jgi:hypothetical protein
MKSHAVIIAAIIARRGGSMLKIRKIIGIHESNKAWARGVIAMSGLTSGSR